LSALVERDQCEREKYDGFPAYDGNRVVYLLSVWLGVDFYSLTLIAALLMSAVIFIFSSNGGGMSNVTDFHVQSQTQIKMENQPLRLRIGPVFWGSLCYMGLSLLLTIGKYVL
jgi:hypothetical protein